MLLRFRLISILYAALAVCGLATAHAQTWTQIGALPPNADLRCAYFWDVNHGVVGGVDCIYTYTNGLWAQATYPEAPDTIKALRLLDGVNLYAASGSTCIWVSGDKGMTWQKTTALYPHADDIFLDSLGTIRGMNFTGTGMMRGTSFARLNAMTCAAARDDATSMIYSTNSGNTWSSGTSLDDGYCCVADTCDGYFYTLTDGVKAQLFQSITGQNWIEIFDFEEQTNDIFDGATYGVLYVQADNGVFRSTDAGLDWTQILGPGSTAEDRHSLFAFGAYDRYLVDLVDNNVWRWDAGSKPVFASLDVLRGGVEKRNGCTFDTVLLSLNLTPNIDTVHLHAATPDGGTISPQDTVVILPASPLGTPPPDIVTIPFRSSVPEFQFSTRFVFNDTVTGQYKCGQFEYVEDTTVTTYLYPADSLVCSVPTPIKFLSCENKRVPLAIRLFTSCDSLRIDSITWIDDSIPLSLDRIGPDSLGNGSIDTFWATLSAPAPGSYSGYLYVHSTSLVTGLTYDTGVYFYAIVSRAPTSPQLSAPPSLTVSNCRASVVSFYLNSLICDSVRFTSCSVTLSKPALYTTNLTFPIDLPPERSDTLQITFPPQDLSGVGTVSVRVKGWYLNTITPFDTTVILRVTFTNSNIAVAPIQNVIDFPTITTCNETDTVTSFKNYGCDTIIVLEDETQWKSGWSATDPRFPDTLPPDSIFSVSLHFAPDTVASFLQQTLMYSFIYPGGKESTMLNLTGSTLPPPISYMLSDTSFDFGTFSRCATMEADTTLTILNTGCDSLLISGASVGAGSGFLLISGNDTSLAPNESISYTLYFSDSIVGSYSSLFHVHGMGVDDGASFDTSLALFATFLPGNRSASIDLDSIDFGTTSICEERDSFVTITNTGCEADTLHGFTFSNAQFASNVNLLFPFILLPDSSTTVPILTALDTTGHAASNAGMLSFALDSGVTVPNVSLTREIQYPVAFALALSAPASAGLDTTLPVIVTRTGTVPSQANELDFDVIYNDNLLSFEQALEPDIVANTGTTLPNGLTDRAFRMVPARDRDTIATLYFKTYLTKETTTDIGLSQERFLVNTAISPPCVAALDTLSTPQRFTLDLDCGDSIILAAWNAAPPFTIQSIVPNPASTDITITGTGLASASAGLYNVLGNPISIPHISSFILYSSSFSLDVSAIPSGTYYLRLSKDGEVQTRRIVIAR